MTRPTAKTLLAAATLSLAAAAVAAAAGNWSTAETRAKDFNTAASALNALVPTEAKIPGHGHLRGRGGRPRGRGQGRLGAGQGHGGAHF